MSAASAASGCPLTSLQASAMNGSPSSIPELCSANRRYSSATPKPRRHRAAPIVETTASVKSGNGALIVPNVALLGEVHGCAFSPADALQKLLQNRGHAWGNQEHQGARTRRFRSRRAPPGAAGSTLGHPLSRLQNGCSASFLVEGGFDSHAPPPLEIELKISTLCSHFERLRCLLRTRESSRLSELAANLLSK
jgi:hypothetical protein